MPILYLLTRVTPRWIIPALELAWGILTLGTFAVQVCCTQDMVSWILKHTIDHRRMQLLQGTKSLYAIRFLVGLAESGFYPAVHYMLGSWYTPRELAKRSSIFYVAGALGKMFSGFLQTAAYQTLNGKHGLPGWRWIFMYVHLSCSSQAEIDPRWPRLMCARRFCLFAAFSIDAIITIPIAIAGFVFLPGLPWNAKPSFWLSQKVGVNKLFSPF